MNSLGNQMVDWLQTFDSDRAKRSYDWLLSFLDDQPRLGVEELAADLRRNKDVYVSIFEKSTTACKMVERIAGDIFIASTQGNPYDDAAIAFNATAFFYLFLLAAETHKATERALSLIEEAYKSALKIFLEMSSSQIDALCSYLLQIRNFLAAMTLSNVRIILIDMPVGNTLSVTLLNDLLKETLI